MDAPAASKGSEGLREFLARTPFFGALDQGSLGFVAGLLHTRSFPAGAQVLTQGECGNSMYVVRRGCLHILRRGAAGHDLKLQLLRPGDFFGVTALVEMEPRPFTVVADQDAELLEITAADLYKLYRHDVKAYALIVMNVNRELCRHLRRAAGLIGQLMDRPDAPPAPDAPADPPAR